MKRKLNQKPMLLACWLALVSAALVLLAARDARAHKPSDSYLVLNRTESGFDLRWDIALRDIDDAVGLGNSSSANVRGSDLEEVRAAISAWAFRGIAFRAGAFDAAGNAECTVTPNAAPLALANHSDGTYLVLRGSVRCAASETMRLEYNLLFDIDAQHRSIVRVENAGAAIVLVASERQRSLALPDPSGSGVPAVAAAHRGFGIVREGVFHILTGYDHILFLVALLLPAVLRREGRAWLPREAWRPVLFDVTKVVTAFTIAHSFTLALAGLGLVSLPSRFVESAIAASVMVAALNNVWPFLPLERWTAAFVLGLMHGFGFSSALADVGASGTTLVGTLFGFNVGVELGQLAVVAVLLPLAFWIRATKLYTPVVLRFGSATIMCVAGVWFVQRAF